jgi:hypothetical protein
MDYYRNDFPQNSDQTSNTVFALNITKYIICVNNLHCSKQEEGRMGARIIVGAVGIRMDRTSWSTGLYGYFAISNEYIHIKYKKEKNSILVRQSENIFLFFVLIQVGDSNGRNNAIISELRRQNKNRKTPTALEIHSVFILSNL